MKKDDVSFIKRKQFEQYYHNCDIYHSTFHGQIEVSLQQDQWKEEYPLSGNDEQERLGPLFKFFLIKKHPVAKPIEDRLDKIIRQHDTCIHTDNLVILDVKRIACIGTGIKEIKD
jgi:hypothetical protein